MWLKVVVLLTLEIIVNALFENVDIQNNSSSISKPTTFSFLDTGFLKDYGTLRKKRQLDVDTPTIGKCFTWSGSHYSTFDANNVISIQSDCTYTLFKNIKDDSIRIDVRNNPCDGTYIAECFRIITIFMGKEVYTLTRNENDVILKTHNDTKSLPIAMKDINVISGRYVMAYMERAGVTLKWDKHYFIELEVSETLWGKTGGMCGLLDGNVHNDLSKSNGEIAIDEISFAKFWQVGVCKIAAKEIKTKLVKSKYAENFCFSIIKPLMECANYLSFLDFAPSCKYDYTQCDHSDPSFCACHSLNVFTTICELRSSKSFRNLLRKQICPIKCKNGKVYMPCGPLEGEAKCDGNFINPVKTCQEGCYCPQDHVINEIGICVPKVSCPCTWKDQKYDVGATRKHYCNTCTCKGGEWSCTTNKCVGEASAYGDPHYTTFDGKKYNFMGIGSYYLAKCDDFEIQASSSPCGSGIPTCTDSVSVLYKNHYIKLDKKIVYVDDIDVTAKLPYEISGAVIKRISYNFNEITLPKGVKVQWDNSNLVKIKLSEEYLDKTIGLFGTFNYNTTDDFLTEEGIIVTSPAVFGNSFKTHPIYNDIPDIPPTHPCKTDKIIQKKAQNFCSKLKSDLFKACHSVIKPDSLYDDCLFDLCASGGDLENYFCPAVSSYADKCAKKGIIIDWRQNIRQCPIKCPLGLEYQICGDTCKRSCFNIGEGDCESECLEGCNCPKGQALNEFDKCVPINQCPCKYKGDIFSVGFSEVRAGPKICTCENAVWNCQNAKPEDLRTTKISKELTDQCKNEDNMIFTICKSKIESTCKNMHKLESEEENCEPGCRCKDDYVFDQYKKKCIPKTDCPCFHAGRSHKENSKIQKNCNICECNKGKWVCTKKNCLAECNIWGDSHYKTFDGKLFDFHGNLEYTLVTSDKFKVTVKTDKCLDSICPKNIRISLRLNEEIFFNLNQSIKIDNFEDYGIFSVRKKEEFLIFEAESVGLVLRWNRRNIIYLKINSKWKNKIAGLCGTYNDNPTDDFTTPEGKLELSPELFGKSWKISSSNEEDTKKSKVDPVKKFQALNMCQILNSDLFEPCHSYVPVDHYIETCIEDAVNCDSLNCTEICSAISVYVQECNKVGLHISWRNDTLCPMKCESNESIYSPCISTCSQETCDELSSSSDICLEDSCIEGCKLKECPLNKIYKNSSYTECVHKETCRQACMKVKDRMYFEGDLVSEDKCKSCFCSRRKKICKGKSCPKLFSEKDYNVIYSKWYKLKEIFTDIKNESEISLKRQIIENRFKQQFNITTFEDIECRSAETHLKLSELGYDVQCNLENGIIYKTKGTIPNIDVRARKLSFDKMYLLATNCAPNEIWDDCAYKCDELCEYNFKIAREKGFCTSLDRCFGSCISKVKQKILCSNQTYWDGYNCIEKNECYCASHNNTLVKPGQIFKETECMICQCINNIYECDKSACKETQNKVLSSIMEAEKHTKLPKMCFMERYTNLIKDLPNEAFGSSSSLNELFTPEHARINNKATGTSGGCWIPKESSNSEYMQIDLGKIHGIYGIIIKGSPSSSINKFVTNFYLYYAKDNNSPMKFIANYLGEPELLNGSTDRKSPVKIIFPEPFEAKIIQIKPQSWYNGIALRIEVLGCKKEDFSQLGDQMGVSNGEIKPDQIKTSSLFNEATSKSQIKLIDNYAWMPMMNTPHEWVQINFLEPRNITGFITKGGPLGWITKYQIIYSTDGQNWNKIANSKFEDKIFTGNFDENSPQINILKLPIGTVYLKIIPIDWYQNIQLRMEIIGNFVPYPEHPVMIPSNCNECPNVKDSELKSGECRCKSYQFWEGKKCVLRSECPCMDKGRRYEIGTIFENEDCSECVCQIGGKIECIPKICPTCDKSLQSKFTKNCECICKSCGENTVLCPTSNVCINSTLWCDGIVHCPDDEINCMNTTLKVNENISSSERNCPEIKCPNNYKILSKRSPTISTTFFNRKRRHTADLSYKEDKDASSSLCPEFTCTTDDSQFICPPMNCPVGYELILSQNIKKTKCPSFECRPITPPDAICKINSPTISKFDNTEYELFLCNHVLALDAAKARWSIQVKTNCSIGCLRDLIIDHGNNKIILHSNSSVTFNGNQYNENQMRKFKNIVDEFQIKYLGNTFIFTSENYGFWVAIDDQMEIRIGVSLQLKSPITGVCGDLNYKSTKEDLKGRNISDNESCQKKNIPILTQNLALNLCNQIRNKIFEDCFTSIEFTKFHSKCLETTTACLIRTKENKISEDECRCKVIEQLAKECNFKNLNDWRTHFDCIIQCKSPFMYQECYDKSEESTCENLSEINLTPKAAENTCFPGCYCPAGLVRKGDNCIKPSVCPNCECNLYPQLDYLTFDFQNFTVNGQCTYLLSRDLLEEYQDEHEFQIFVQNVPCNSNQFCIGNIIIHYDSFKIEVFYNKTSNNLQYVGNIKSITEFDNSISIRRNKSKHFEIILKKISVEIRVYFPSLGIAIKVPSKKFGGRLEGLCGDCNGNPNDDFKFPNGTLIRNSIEFVKSWAGNETDSESCLNVKEICEDNKLAENEDPCMRLMDKKIFGKCHPVLDPTLFLNWCKKEICGNPLEYACKAIETYAKQCLTYGICIDWRYDLCPAPVCPHGQTYNACGTSCPTTCTRNIENCENSYSEGCFCPEGKVAMNGYCIDQQECLICDKEGHRSGERWIKDACTTCECIGTSLSCVTQQCTNIDTICSPGYTLFKLTKSPSECCEKTICVRENDYNSICPFQEKPKCTTNEILKLSYSGNCLNFYCECKPKEECKVVNLELQTYLEEGIVKLIDDTGCCPVEKLICNPDTCKKRINCPEFYEIKETFLPEKCCPKITCELPKKCIVILATTNEKIVKEVNEIWTDGPCKTCKCHGSDDTGYTPHCITTKCPDLTSLEDAANYQLSISRVPDLCCPEIKRIACKYNNTVFPIGGEWFTPENPCVKMRCLYSENFEAKLVRELMSCQMSCEYGFEYRPPKNGDCCGFCRQIGCIDENRLRRIGESWTSLDNCTYYSCQKVLANVQIQSSTKICPSIPKEILDNYEVVEEYKEGECCKTYKTISCKDGSKNYAEGDSWFTSKNRNTKMKCIKLPYGGLLKLEDNVTSIVGELQTKDTCTLETIEPHNTVGMIEFTDLDHGLCRNKDFIYGLNKCKGYCGTRNLFDEGLGYKRNICSYCGGKKFDEIAIDMECVDGYTFAHLIKSPVKCKCRLSSKKTKYQGKNISSQSNA